MKAITCNPSLSSLPQDQWFQFILRDDRNGKDYVSSSGHLYHAYDEKGAPVEDLDGYRKGSNSKRRRGPSNNIHDCVYISRTLVFRPNGRNAKNAALKNVFESYDGERFIPKGDGTYYDLGGRDCTGGHAINNDNGTTTYTWDNLNVDAMKFRHSGEWISYVFRKRKELLDNYLSLHPPNMPPTMASLPPPAYSLPLRAPSTPQGRSTLITVHTPSTPMEDIERAMSSMSTNMATSYQQNQITQQQSQIAQQQLTSDVSGILSISARNYALGQENRTAISHVGTRQRSSQHNQNLQDLTNLSSAYMMQCLVEASGDEELLNDGSFECTVYQAAKRLLAIDTTLLHDGGRNLLSPIPPEGSLTHVENLCISSSVGSVLFHHAINIAVIGLARFVEMIGLFMAKLVQFESEGGIVTEMERAICSSVTVTLNSPDAVDQTLQCENGLEHLKDYVSQQCSQIGVIVIRKSIGFNRLVGQVHWQLKASPVQSPEAALESGQPTSTTLTERSGAPQASVPSGDTSIGNPEAFSFPEEEDDDSLLGSPSESATKEGVEDDDSVTEDRSQQENCPPTSSNTHLDDIPLLPEDSDDSFVQPSSKSNTEEDLQKQTLSQMEAANDAAPSQNQPSGDDLGKFKLAVLATDDNGTSGWNAVDLGDNPTCTLESDRIIFQGDPESEFKGIMRAAWFSNNPWLTYTKSRKKLFTVYFRSIFFASGGNTPQLKTLRLSVDLNYETKLVQVLEKAGVKESQDEGERV